MSRLPGTDLTFWPADTRLPAVVQVAVPLVFVLFTAGVAGVATASSRTRSTRQVHVARLPRWWWLAPFAAGLLVLLFATLVEGGRSPTAKRDAIVAATLTMLGLPLALQVLVAALSEEVSRRAPTADRLIAGRWLGNRQGATFRLALGLAVGSLSFSVTAPFATSLQGDTRPGQRGLAAANGYNLLLTNLTLAPQAVRQLPGVRQAIDIGTATNRSRDSVDVLFASCRQLRAFVTVSGCNGRPQWINAYRDQPISGYVSGVKAPLRIRFRGRRRCASFPAARSTLP